MSKFSIKSIAAIAAAIVFSLATAAFAAHTPCVSLSASISSGSVSGQTITVSAGAPVTFTGTVSNCSTGNETVVINYTYESSDAGACTVSQTGSLKTKLGAGDAYTKVLTYTAPSCPGTYTVTLTAVASAGSQTSTPSSTTVTLNVQ
jgi:hypothetical protein